MGVGSGFEIPGFWPSKHFGAQNRAPICEKSDFVKRDFVKNPIFEKSDFVKNPIFKVDSNDQFELILSIL